MISISPNIKFSDNVVFLKSSLSDNPVMIFSIGEKFEIYVTFYPECQPFDFVITSIIDKNQYSWFDFASSYPGLSNMNEIANLSETIIQRILKNYNGRFISCTFKPRTEPQYLARVVSINRKNVL